jgi:hypothetical protein
MKYQYKWFFLLLVLVVFFVAGWAAQGQKYTAIHIERDGQIPSKYNELGEKGWELVTVNSDGWSYFKRLKK